MHQRAFGATGITGSALGLGTGRLGGDELSDLEAQRLLEGALALGVTVFDSAPSYGHAERRLGDFVRRHREVTVSTKGGYGVAGVADWTAECIERGVDQALARLGLERIDFFHLHSCPREVLERGGVLEALERARQAGKVRCVAYSGENDALAFASQRCQAIQCSVNVADQRSIDQVIAPAARAGVAVFAKRPLANGVWRHAERPAGVYGEVYWQRVREMGLEFGARWLEVAVRFSVFTPGVSSAFVGSRDLAHLGACVRAVELGPLPADELAALRGAFQRHGAHWAGEI